MSERSLAIPMWLLVVAVSIAAIGSGVEGFHEGLRLGRDEQAKMDAAKGFADPQPHMQIRVIKTEVESGGFTVKTWISIPDGWVPDGWKLIDEAPLAPPKRERKPANCPYAECVTISKAVYDDALNQLETDRVALGKATEQIEQLTQERRQQFILGPQTMPFVITILPDETEQKAACEKRGGHWDHMDGTSCYATNPAICSSHCDDGVPAEAPKPQEQPQ